MIMIGQTLEMLVPTISIRPDSNSGNTGSACPSDSSIRAEQTHGKQQHYGQQPGKQIPTYVPTLLNITQYTHNIDPLSPIHLSHLTSYLTHQATTLETS